MTDNPAAETTAQPQAEAKPEAQTASAETNADVFDKDRAMELINKLRGEIKDLKPLAKKASDLEALAKAKAEADMTELQKAQAKIAEQEALIKASTRREMQREVAKEFKLPDALVELLPGDDKETMAAKAKALAEALPKPTLSPTNPAGNAQETDAQKRQRLLGGNPSIWQGGGVQWVDHKP